jgi:response regulator of citrate/malate metabolism
MGNQMKIVMAIIKPFKLDEVREALTGYRHSGPDRQRSQRLWQAEGAH